MTTRQNIRNVKMVSAEVLALIEQAAIEGWTELDLSMQNLATFPLEICKLTHLQDLDLRGNQIKEIPDAIAELTNLQSLYLNGNKIKEIPEAVGELTNLQSLYLNGNKIKEIPKVIGHLTNLQFLYLNENQIKEIPEAVGELSNLQSLYLIRNQIKEIPEAVGGLANLQRLYLRGNQIKEIPEAVGGLTNLQSLNLNGNQIISIPEVIANLTHLQSLYLWGNQIKEIPEAIGQLTHLQYLDLNGNKIKEIPEVIGQLTHLQILNFNENQIKEIPEVIGQLTHLQTLNLNGNQIKKIPDTIIQLTKLQSLYLWGNQIEEIPSAITKLTNLHNLELSGNNIKKIPEAIAKLTNLQFLYLWGNQIEEIPSAITKLTNLQILYLNGNHIKEIPKAIAKLINLQHLDLSENKIEKIPNSIKYLIRIEQLSLWNNKIQEIPEVFSYLTNLEILDLNENQISEIPHCLKGLKKLDKLDLRNNPISIPPNILAHIEYGKIYPKARPILEYYFRTQDQTQTTNIYEVKVLIVGEGGSGKTSLAKKIIDPDYELLPETRDITTEGIDIFRWDFVGRNHQTYRVNIWDFGGQEIYHQTHQFFLTERSLYLLVADSRKEHTDHYFWLNIIRLLSQSSPVHLIQNEKQNRSCNLNLPELRAEFDNLDNHSPTLNLADNRGLREAKTLIQNSLETLCPGGIPFPNSWLNVRYTLENDGRNYIECSEYEATCRRHGISERTEMYNLSYFLHSLGICLHFQKDPILRHRLILKPNWGTDAVYKILDNKKVRKELGQFNDADLHNIWRDSQYADMHHELLQLMKEFKVCYEIPRRSGHYIAPHLLSSTAPDYTFERTTALLLRYRYPTFLPKGILTRFIVEMHQDIENVSDPDTALVWKNGVILNRNNARAEIIERTYNREIQIRVSGKNQRDFLVIIHAEFQKIHDQFEDQLDYETLIPCNCDTCKTRIDPYTYELSRLEEFVQKKRYTIQCYESGDYVDVRRLLYDSIEPRLNGQTEEELLTSRKSHRSQVLTRKPAMSEDSKKPENSKKPEDSKNAFDLRGANIGNLVVEAKDEAQVTAQNFTQNSGIKTEDLLEILAIMRQQVTAFPAESQADLLEDLDDVETELNQDPTNRNQDKLFRRLKRIATTAVASFVLMANPVAGMADFLNNVTDLAGKVEPAQVQVIQDIVHKALPLGH